jgi:hypothetical protein
VQWLLLVIPALGRQRLEDGELEARKKLRTMAHTCNPSYVGWLRSEGSAYANNLRDPPSPK